MVETDIKIKYATPTADMAITRPTTSSWKDEDDYMDVVTFDDHVDIGVQDAGNYGEYSPEVHSFMLDGYAVQKLHDFLGSWLNKQTRGNEEPEEG